MKAILHTTVKIDFEFISRCEEGGKYYDSKYEALIVKHVSRMTGRGAQDIVVRVSMENDAAPCVRCDIKLEKPMYDKNETWRPEQEIVII